MKKDTLLNYLKHWLKFESCVDKDGNISPSKLAIDITHFYFIHDPRWSKNVENIRSDQQGGILIDVFSNNQNYQFVLHVAFDGYVNYYQVTDDGYIDKTKMIPRKDKGFGTNKYKF